MVNISTYSKDEVNLIRMRRFGAIWEPLEQFTWVRKYFRRDQNSHRPSLFWVTAPTDIFHQSVQCNWKILLFYGPKLDSFNDCEMPSTSWEKFLLFVTSLTFLLGNLSLVRKQKQRKNASVKSAKWRRVRELRIPWNCRIRHFQLHGGPSRTPQCARNVSSGTNWQASEVEPRPPAAHKFPGVLY